VWSVDNEPAAMREAQQQVSSGGSIEVRDHAGDVAEWPPDIEEARLDGPLRQGTHGMIETRSGGKHDVVVTMVEPGRAFELESTAMPITRMAIRASVAPLASGARMTQAFDPRGPLAPLVGPLMSGAIPGTFEKVLAGLASKVEAH
jgi:hypothetical protein